MPLARERFKLYIDCVLVTEKSLTPSVIAPAKNFQVTVAQLADHDTLIDARTPAEFAADHLPDALSCPVLSNDERARVGTVYKQVSPFAAKKLGAALIARNIADHLEQSFADHPKTWRPLIYCWRGGQRSAAFVHILREIGWDAKQLDGGYKAWRAQVIDDLTVLPSRFSFQVVSGATGSAKSRLLEAIAAQGGQILHLEQLAQHKGSVLGGLTDTPQPSQRLFESRLWRALSKMDAKRPVFAEAESRRIGRLQVPDALLFALRQAPCLTIEASEAARVDYILQDYVWLTGETAWLSAKLEHLRRLVGHETVERWQALARNGDFPALVAALLSQHYDPLYRASQTKNYTQHKSARRFRLDDLSPEAIQQLARTVLAAG